MAQTGMIARMQSTFKMAKLIEICYGHLLNAGGKETPSVRCAECVHSDGNKDCHYYKPAWMNTTGLRQVTISYTQPKSI